MPTLSARGSVIAGLLIVTLGAAGAGAQGRGQALPGGGRGRGAAPPARDARPADDTPAGTASIVGTIVVAGGGTPARRARVTLNGEALRSSRAVTADDE